ESRQMPMLRPRTECPSVGQDRTSPLSLLPYVWAGLVAILVTAPAMAQQPTPAQVQQALQQPGMADQVRSRIAQSGLTPDQIRSRLAASGYPANMLDPYLASTAVVSSEPSAQEMAALQSLGLPALSSAGLAYDTGLVRA